MGKIELTLQIDAGLLAEARESGVDLAAAIESALRAKFSERAGAEKARQWAEENRDAIQAHRERIEIVGVCGQDPTAP